MIPRPTSNRHNGCVFEASTASTSSCALPRADAVERHELLDGELVDVTCVLDEAGVGELADPFLAEAFDVHRAAPGEVHDALHALHGAVDVDAVVVRLTFEPDERLPAVGALRGELPLPRALAALGEDRTDDLGDDIAGPAHDHRVALADVLPGHVVLVVQCGERDVGAPDEHRLEDRERRRPARAADADHDVAQDRRLLFGRELVRDRPARRTRRRSHLGALAEVVDLHHDTVDVVAERVALRFHLAAELEHRVEVVERLDVRVDREAEIREPGQRLGMRSQPRATLERARLIAVHRQVTRRGDAGILLAQAPGRRVARVDEEPLVRLALPLVQIGERRERHEHLAAHLEQRRNVLALQALRDHADRAQVLGDVFTGHTVAPGRADREPSVLVLQRDRETVELRLGDVPHGFGDEPLDAGRPRAQVVERERVVEREHPHSVFDRGEGRHGTPAGSLRRRVGRDELGVLRLELAQLPHERVELGVAELGVVEDEVALGVVVDQLAQRGDAFDDILRSGRGHVGQIS